MRLDPNIITRDIDQLLLQCPELMDDDTLRDDMISGETEAFELLSLLLRRHGATKAMSEATKAYCEELTERSSRLDNRVKAYRTLIHKIMDHAKLRKKELPEGTISIGKGREKLCIPDETAVPMDYCLLKPSPDRDAIRKALEAGVELDWAAIVTGDPVLSIRTK